LASAFDLVPPITLSLLRSGESRSRGGCRCSLPSVGIVAAAIATAINRQLIFRGGTNHKACILCLKLPLQLFTQKLILVHGNG
jgi:hypothetical protein